MQRTSHSIPTLATLVLAACHQTVAPAAHDDLLCLASAPSPPTFDDASCPIVHPPADVLDTTLALVDLDRCTLGYSAADYSAYDSAMIADPFRLPWYDAVHDHSVRAPAFARDLTGRLDAAHGSSLRLGDAVAIAAESLEAPQLGCLDDLPIDEVEPFASAVAQVILDAGGVPDVAALRADAADVPRELQLALAKVVLAAGEAQILFERVLAPLSQDERAVLANVSSLFLTTLDGTLDVTDGNVYELLASRFDLSSVAAGAARLAARLDGAHLERFRGATGFAFDQLTPVGRILIRDAADDVYLDDGSQFLLLVDTGGSDRYLTPVGAVNVSGDVTGHHHVSIAVDLAGSDTYGYTPTPDPSDDGRLPSDAAGRYHSAYPPTEDYGPVSLSETPRQGGARLGYGFLLDLGAESDSYQSLRMSQGYGAAGVGVLYDAGGDDTYRAEAAAQGAATFGIGMLIDDSGNDDYEAYVMTQGFGFVRGVGVLDDATGDDQYLANTGDPALGGDPIYLSVQIPGTANDNFAQGAGFGRNASSDDAYMSGGLGLLRDGAGDDTYRAAVYSQASGYWYGTGILADQEGNDQYDGRYYVQGSGAHFAMDVFLDEAGDDNYNQVFTPKATSIGIGHDYTVSWHLDGGGNDRYRGPGLSLGGGNANGLGVLINIGGDDLYESAGEPTLGVGNLSSEVDTWPERQPVPTTGVFIDIGGHDTYLVTSNVTRGDDVSWINNREPPEMGITSEHGVGVDCEEGTVALP